MRVLMVHWDGAGNLNAQRALARELGRRGHEVHVLTHDSVASAVAADGGAFHPLKTAAQWDPALPITEAEEVAFLVDHVLGSAEFAADFLAARDALRPDVCLIDAMLISTMNLAVERKIPFVAFNHLAWIIEGRCAGVMGAIGAGLPGSPSGSTFFSLVERAPMVLAASYREFGAGGNPPPHVHFVGPIREAVAQTPWPRRRPGRPLALVSLSSAFQRQEATLRNVCEALAGLPIEALVTTGRGVSPESLPAAEGLEARAFVPHDVVLPYADLVITHAGLGTLMYAAGTGVPSLCLPNGRDQDDNAGRITALGLGSAISPSASPDEIRTRVETMLGDSAMAEACRSFAAGVSRFGELAHAAELVEDFARASTPG